MLTTVSLYWFGELGWSSAHAVYEGMQVYRRFAAAASAASSGDGDGDGDWGGASGWQAPPMPPTAASIFAADLSVRAVVDPAGTYESWTEHASGGHFPAMEVPDLLVTDIRTFFDAHR